VPLMLENQNIFTALKNSFVRRLASSI